MGQLRRPDTTIAFQVRGLGPTVLMLQGVGARALVWAPQMDPLSDRWQCVAVDNRGLGDSGAAPGGLRIGQMVDDAIAVLDHLGIARAHVIGHSMGGILAHQLALDHPDRVASLGLLCTFTTGKEAVSLGPRSFALGLRAAIGTRRMRRLAFLRLIAPSSALQGDLDATAERHARVFGHDLADRHPISRGSGCESRVRDPTTALAPAGSHFAGSEMQD
ncbi:Beta-ketoadipate enol-lactone hydrolase [Enhygromyxa salina]|uniref:Beta-ketoadipate enol-lactone hydrolase n=1 Tax=Enhygromyxa salina TaxID=215803 RepID=A0A0C1ZC14_9BACT|nr:alpha/beta fold hydrolase [Enhygromyxa salina]KIG15239.1 Beta-ketoadipate enol-lactone hydrolase [Enhygromyxa salina]